LVGVLVGVEVTLGVGVTVGVWVFVCVGVTVGVTLEVGVGVGIPEILIHMGSSLQTPIGLTKTFVTPFATVIIFPDTKPLIGTLVLSTIVVPLVHELSVQPDKLTFVILSPPVNVTVV
jgi:hypothetical protein